MLFGMNPILIAAAVIPAIILLCYVNSRDKLDRESPRMLISLVLLGALSTLFAMIVEVIGHYATLLVFTEDSTAYNLVYYSGIVAFAEEGGKYIVLKKRTWRSPEFNCQFDGVVYAVFVSLGFALWENIKYVSLYGLGTALLRAVTAVPGHACFGVFMGVFYGMAKRCDNVGNRPEAVRYRRTALIMAALIHGFYDFCLSEDSAFFSLIFIPFILLLFVLAFWLVRRMSADDRYISDPTLTLEELLQRNAEQRRQEYEAAQSDSPWMPNGYNGYDAAPPETPRYGGQNDIPPYDPRRFG